MTLLSLLIVGFFVGMRHAVESDHLAAIATLATRRQSLGSNLRQGIAWGLGHTLTLMLIGSVVLAMGTSIPQRLEHLLETCVGLMLVVLGADVLRRMHREKIHFHVHHHEGGVTHFHAHSHSSEPEARRLRMAIVNPNHLPLLDLNAAQHRNQHDHDHEHRWPIRALAIGVMHGLAGSAALVLLSLDAVSSVPLALIYILVFGFGSIVGMMLLSVAIAVPLRLSSRYVTSVYRSLTIAIAILTMCLGASVVYSVGIRGGPLLG